MYVVQRISGVLIFFSFIFTIYAYFFQKNILILAISFIWIASILLFFTLEKRKLIYILLFCSFISFLYSYANGFYIDFFKALSVNQYLLTLLIAVGFLKLIATPRKEKNTELPRGKNSFLKTYLSVHLFGSVINLSSLLLVADKMYKKAPLSPSQIVLLTRSFASDAYWSPFFVAFAAAITYAPNLQTYTIISFGLFLAFFAFLITYFEVIDTKKFNLDDFYGYPLSLQTLYLPLVLAFFVLLTHYFYEDLKIIVLISSFAFLMTILILPIKKGFFESSKILKFYILDELPKMKSEISLFLVAGLFGISMGSVLIGLNFTLPFEVFDYKVASILLFIFISLSFIGIHPIISISILGDFFVDANHTLLAMTFLMSWATTVSTSPISGLNLTMSSRYSCSAKEIFKLNIFYAFKMYIICVICLFILSKFLGI
ncbi:MULTISPECIES: tellurium resistance protein TerC [Arcobacteraceae]|uniref:tellurium resistance protein TerC n=1 Tax=Arcobacteraceae TaxID=2808963 RepID=UPI000DEBBAB7|nr:MULTISPECIES: tellurium resistance protein TerC [Arcobacteraceae]MBL3519249.1 tellurium resistance protein TerC [Aliarcobacter lanthieri]RBQ25807.1 tellurium resistance protein TerC [Arcobacter sp. CECT 9188]